MHENTNYMHESFKSNQDYSSIFAVLWKSNTYFNTNSSSKMKKLLTLLFCVQLACSAMAAPWTGTIASSFSGGDGSQATPFLIGTGDELAYLAQLTNDTASYSTGKYFQLTADIDLGNVVWTPIGKNTTNYKFAGVFDGNNKVVSNIYYNAIVTTTNSYVGLFGYIAGATPGSAIVKNITISGSITAANFVGGIVGRADNTAFTNCKNAAYVKASTNASGTTVGGIVGRLGGGSSLINCSNSGTIIGVNDYAGGMAGNAAFGTTASPTIMQYCYNSGSVSGSTKYVGGMAGYGGGGITIDQCFNSGKISALQGASGGIDGYGGDVTKWVIITNCYNTGTVSGAGAQSGGILGFTNTGKWFYNITNCYNTGTVSNATTSEAIAGQIVTPITLTGAGVVSNCYYLTGSATTNANGGVVKTGSELQDAGFVTTMNNGSSLWSTDGSNLNTGYPILAWQSTYSVLTTPTANAATSIIATGCTANWTTVANAVGYSIKVYDSGSVLRFTFSANGQATSSMALTDLVTNTYYTYKVTAIGNSSTFDSPESASSPSFIPGAPVLTATSTPTKLSSTSVSIDGNVTADGGVSPISDRGVCWGTVSNPTIADNMVSSGTTGLGSFTTTITSLTANTTYYARAYATNTSRTSYGTQVSFISNQLSISSAVASSALTNLDASSVVTVSNGGTLTIDAPTTIDAITIQRGGKVTNESSLNVATFTINSDASGTGTFTDSNPVGGLTVTGTTTVNQSLQHSGALRSWYLTPPVASAAPSGMDAIKSYDEATYTWSAHTPTMVAKTGYIVNPTAAENNLAFTGALNNNDLDITLTSRTGIANKAGFNLIGNPYPSFLDWKQVCDYTADAGVTYPNQLAMRSTTMWYRTKAGSYTFYTVNGTSGVGTPVEASKNIPPMQAFWVRAVAGGGTLALKNTMRLHESTTNLLKASSLRKSANPLVRLQVSNGTNTDEAVLHISNNAANELDAYDSPKMSNENAAVPEIYTTVGSEKVVINGMNSIPMDQPLGLGFVAGNATSFSIKANEVTGLPSDVKLILKDNVTLKETDLTDGVSVYGFTPAVTNADRFSIIFRSPGAVTGLESAQKERVIVYSNAAKQLTILCNEALTQGSMVSIYNAVGQKLLTAPTTGASTLIQQSFSAGVYFVTVTGVGSKLTQKVVIN